MKTWLKENKQYIYNSLWALLFLVILFLILTNRDLSVCSGYDSCVW